MIGVVDMRHGGFRRFAKNVDDQMKILNKHPDMFPNEEEQGIITREIHELIDKLNQFISFINREPPPIYEEEEAGGGKRPKNKRQKKTRKHRRSYKK